MSNDSWRDAAPTRRDTIKYGGAALGGGLLAGCTDNVGYSGADTEGNYSVTMAPVGTVEFEEAPERVVHYFPDYGDMAVALGHGDSVLSMGLPSRFHTTHYEELDGVSVDAESLTRLSDNGIDRELFYELDGDLHLIDPQWLINNSAFKLEESDIEEVGNTVAPFIGNTIFRRTDEWHDYRYYTLYEAFEKVAKIYQEQERFTQLKQFHDDVLADVQADLPPADDRPNALLTFAAANEPEAFYPYRVSDQGTNKKQFRDLGITDALADTGIEGLSTTERGQIDYETMLEVDPDSILIRGHENKSRAEFEDTVLAFMKDHGTASELTAVQNDMVFRGGPIYSGPLHHLFLLERYATGYFPETYSEELFDREELAAIVTGEE
ncbi:ABC transporter substrate-binding protein [Natronomonas sp. CBA1123]|uniref:ABC transporter substrate-binding protein n=1 Tax=Natronomonas sp. CBA1123 TaxID=2668070 RepID=UPI0012E9CA64|nr:ABC transporter substrate-binding protein [Natronomonas sp. CBA1123]MUV85067.1 ABC transporter substrate-binding protein [Natronomonas sp. CBA1123]